MHVRHSHFEIDATDNSDFVDQDLEALFYHAQERKHAWITGFHKDVDGEDVIWVADAAGYDVWMPEITANGVTKRVNHWVAVRQDLIDGELDKFFDLVQPGKGQSDENVLGDPHGFVSVSFRTKAEGLGRIHVATSRLSAMTQDLMEDWHENALDREDLGSFGTPGGGSRLFPPLYSGTARFTGSSDTTQSIHFFNDCFYAERTTGVKKLAPQ